MQSAEIDRRPLHVRIYQYLLGLIEDGTYQHGQQLPPETELAAQLGVSRPSLREALLNLEQDGLIIRRHGVGTFVSSPNSPPLESGLEQLESVLDLSARQGLATQVRDLQVEQVAAGKDLASILDVATGTALTCVRRTIVIGRKPAAYLVDYCPVAVLPLEALDGSFNGSVLDLLMQRRDVDLREALSEITALQAGEELAERLAVKPGAAILLLTETLFDGERAPVEFSRNYFVPDQFRFHVVRR